MFVKWIQHACGIHCEMINTEQHRCDGSMTRLYMCSCIREILVQIYFYYGENTRVIDSAERLANDHMH
jgi:hypothetical protein